MVLEFDVEWEDIFSYNQCFIADRIINENIATSLSLIESGEQFAFYNLSLSREEQQILSNLEILEFNNIIINSNSSSVLLIQEIYQHIFNMDGMQVDDNDIANLLNIIMRITSTIVGQTASQKFELTLRTREGYVEENNCIFWHLDKTKQEILNQNLVEQPELRFIVPLKGSGTNYQNINITIRNAFLEVAEEAPYYFGHGLEGCVENDKILNLLSSAEIYKTKINFGSVHVAGKDGAMHAAPKISDNRLLLLITVLLQGNK